MINRFPVTKLAKKKAKQALEIRKSLPSSKQFGITKEQADKLNIASGVSRAKQLVNSQTIPLEDAKKVARFYSRFKNCKTFKCEKAIDLWGGRQYGKMLYNKIYGSSKNRTHFSNKFKKKIKNE